MSGGGWAPLAYDLDLNPFPAHDLRRVGEVMADARRTLAVTELTTPGGPGRPAMRLVVSTVFLVIDHGHDGAPPVLWETMVFGSGEPVAQVRYTSAAAALEGHRELVARWRAGQGA